jgi:hypothetical protein
VNPHNFYRSLPSDWEPVTRRIDPECEVTVTDSAGKRWTMKVRARSMYEAVFAYASRQCCGSPNEREYPKLGQQYS